MPPSFLAGKNTIPCALSSDDLPFVLSIMKSTMKFGHIVIITGGVL